MDLIWPSLETLPSFVDALHRGWAPRNVDGAAAIRDALEEIRRDPGGFIGRQIDRLAEGPAIRLPDGSVVPRLPSFTRWMWDGEFCGLIGFRWQPGTPALPPHVLGHIGYTVVPWKRQRGYATAALRQFLDEVRPEGLPYVELTADPDNLPSHRVITANGGVMVGRFTKTAAFGGGEGLRFRIELSR
ncbi:MAG: GNAT family N-acetyltransferase [Verrucomicrobia bacterium]|nr:GNAT family N-acetyltransferase [Verrucomicrobiota bacterium]